MEAFKRITLQHWRQFDEVDIEFHPRLTVLTGANGAGKTTILTLLNRHFGWNLSFVSTPVRRRKLLKYFADYWEGKVPDSIDPPAAQHDIGTITYSNDSVATLSVPTNVDQQYSVQIANQNAVDGIFVSSHRPVYLYQRVDSIPTQLDAREQLFTAYMDEMRERYSVNGRVRSPSHRIKEALISLATFGYGNEIVRASPEAIRTFEGFQDILKIVLPKSLGFRGIRVEIPDVLLQTDTGTFSLDSVSGVVSSIVDLAWQIYMYSLSHPEFCVIVDEPENHLHPELQRLLLPSFMNAFPGSQFIVATHNPLIVGSVSDSNVYVLDYNPNRQVTSQLLDTVNKAGTSNEILRDVLGLPNTIPLWVEARLDTIVEKYGRLDFDRETLIALREEMRAIGLENLLPTAVHDIVDPDD